MIIRLAVSEDIPSIMLVIAAVVPAMIADGNFQWDSTYPNPAVFTNDINQERLWVAEIDNEIAGVAALCTDKEPEYAQLDWDLNLPAVITHRLAVNPKFRGQGVAAQLLMQAEKVAITKGINVLRVDTNSKNQATQRLFPKLGYVYVGEITLAFRDGLRFFCYEKKIF